MPSNWLLATQARGRAIEATLTCSRCAATNEPGKTVVVFDLRAWTALCLACGHSFAVEDGTA